MVLQKNTPKNLNLVEIDFSSYSKMNRFLKHNFGSTRGGTLTAVGYRRAQGPNFPWILDISSTRTFN